MKPFLWVLSYLFLFFLWQLNGFSFVDLTENIFLFFYLIMLAGLKYLKMSLVTTTFENLVNFFNTVGKNLVELFELFENLISFYISQFFYGDRFFFFVFFTCIFLLIYSWWDLKQWKFIFFFNFDFVISIDDLFFYFYLKLIEIYTFGSFFILKDLFFFLTLPSFFSLIFFLFVLNLYVDHYSEYGASIRREDWFLYQEWFKTYKGKSTTQLVRSKQFMYFTDEEINSDFYNPNLYNTVSSNQETFYFYVDEQGVKEKYTNRVRDFWKKKRIAKEDRKMAVYFYYLNLNDKMLTRKLDEKKRMVHYRQKFGNFVFDELVLKKDQKMAKVITMKLSSEGEFKNFNIENK